MNVLRAQRLDPAHWLTAFHHDLSALAIGHEVGCASARICPERSTFERFYHGGRTSERLRELSIGDQIVDLNAGIVAPLRMNGEDAVVLAGLLAKYHSRERNTPALAKDGGGYEVIQNGAKAYTSRTRLISTNERRQKNTNAPLITCLNTA